MFQIRQPIPRLMSIGLGFASILSLIAIYTLISNDRAQTERGNSVQLLANVESQLVELQKSDSANASQIRRLQGQIDRLRDDSQNAIDRTMPTWDSLYRDGLLKSLRTKGLREYEYWLLDDAKATFLRLAAGLLVGVALSMILGILMGSYTWIEAFFVPPLSFLAKIPPTAMLSVFFVLVGTTFQMYVTMIAFGILPTLAQTIYQSVKADVPETLVYKAYTLGASHDELIWNVIYKQILPRLIDAVRLQIGPAMVLLVAAEWMVAGEGFGYRLRLFYQRTDMTVVYVYLIILGVVGLLTDYLLIWIRKQLCPWFQ